jgi:hypothetical protein
MPDTAKSSQTAVPSITGSTPVKDVLQRIQTRDPNRKHVPGYARRMEDFEFHWDLKSTLAAGVVAIIIGGFLVMPLFKSTRWMSHPQPTTAPASLPGTQGEMPLSIPKGIQSTPSPGPSLPLGERTVQVAPDVNAPQNLRINYLGPRTVEVRWQGVGEGYRYLLYSSVDPTFENAQLIIEQPVASNHATWLPDAETQSAWIAIQALNPEGRAVSFSQPVLVQLPPV